MAIRALAAALCASVLTLSSPAVAADFTDEQLEEIFAGAAVDELLEALKTIVFIEQIDRACGNFGDYRTELPDARSALYEKFEETVDASRSFIQSQIATSERYYRERIQGVVLNGCGGANFDRGVEDLRTHFELIVRPPSASDPVSEEKALQYYNQCALETCSTESDQAQCVIVCACSAHRVRQAMTGEMLDIMMFEVQAHHIKRQAPEFDPRFKDLPADARPKKLPPPSMEELKAANAERDAIMAGPLLDVVEGCEADILAGYGRKG